MSALLALILVLTAPEVSVEAPDTVGTGEVFTVEIRVTGADLNGARCVPASNGGLDYLGSGTAYSMSSTTTPNGTSRVSELVVSLSFSAPGPGEYELGPFTFTASGTGRMELPGVTVVAVGAGRSPGSRDRTTPRVPEGPDGAPAWIEVAVDTSGTIHPGCAFQVSYFLCSRRSDIWSVNYRIHGSDYAGSRTLESPDELVWRRGQAGERRSLLATLEILPAFPCSLTLPVIRGTVTLRDGFIETEYDLTGDSAWVPVMPFPEEGRPENFTGAAAPFTLTLSRISGSTSLARERCLDLVVAGPGSGLIEDPPALTVSGPAEVRLGPRGERLTGECAGWPVLVQPTDSGTVILGPDSLAWFDADQGIYRQSVMPACTIAVRAPLRTAELPVLDLGGDGGPQILLWTAAILLLAVPALLRLRRKRGVRRSIAEADDAEELLTALEGELRRMLPGTGSSMGFEELGEALDDAGADNILSRRLLRFWKDLEMHLSGRKLSAEQLETLRGTASELLEELAAELGRLRG